MGYKYDEVINPMVGIYYENEVPYLNLKFDYNSIDSKGIKTLMNVDIHKIGLNGMGFDIVQDKNGVKEAKICMDMFVGKEENYIFCKFAEIPPKEMTKEEIEKELGYKITLK